MGWFSKGEQPKQDREEPFPVEHIDTLEEIDRKLFEAFKEDMNRANPHLPPIETTYEEYKAVKPTIR